MNQKGFANIIFVIVIVALVGAGGYFVFVKKSPIVQQPEPTQTPTQTPTPTQTTTPNPTSTTLSTGLPKEIENNKGFKSFISDKLGSVEQSLIPFKVLLQEKLNLQSKRIDTDKNRNLYFDNSGNPIFMLPEPKDKIKIEGYSPDKRYASEVVASEPDTFVYVWDIKEKKVYQVSSCGTVCGFNGMDWLSSERLIVWGNGANPFENYDWSKGSAKFVTLFDLKNLTVATYSSKIIPPKK